MLKRLIAGALFAGLSAGALGALVQMTFVVPLIEQGELYESGALVHVPGAGGGHADHAAPDAAEVADHDHAPDTPAEHDHPVAAPAFDTARAVQTFGMFLISYTGFALVMVAGFALAERAGHRVTARQGAVWGLAGFVAVQLAPAFGLPPELPGAAAAALEQRQVWWAFCVAATVAGIAALTFGRSALVLAAGVLAIALPHLVGAPEAAYGGVAPPELAAHFATRALGAGAVCWTLLGLIAGAIWARDGQDG